MNDLLEDNNFFIFDDVNVRISLVGKMPFRKKPRDSMHECSKSNMIKSLPRTVYKWLPKLQPLAEPVAKWFPRIVQICLWIIDSGCSKHMAGNRALLTNFVEKFLETVRFGNNVFAVIAGYGEELLVKNVYRHMLRGSVLTMIENFQRSNFSSSYDVDAGGNPPPVTIHTWLERFNKQKPHSFEKATAPVDAENWISHMEKIFDVMGCEDAFKTRLAVYKFEGNVLAWWKAYKQAKGGDAWLVTVT
nr:zinc finger, CCHC-type, retrotransposon Gag domain protein [Tanacetum cinerariifolium]